MRNQPYRKFEVEGEVMNPVTPDKPFLHTGMNRRVRKRFIKQLIKKSKQNVKRN